MTTLRYFDCRGRAEPLRYMLEDWEVAYTDEVVKLNRQEWNEKREMSSFAGPFGQLPILEWADPEELRTVAQTLAIAQYVGMKCDPVLRGNVVQAEQITKAMSYGCCAYEDLLMKILGAIGDPSQGLRVFGQVVPKALERFDHVLSVMEEKVFDVQSSAVNPEEYLTEGVYLLGSSPAWPDYIFFHAVSLLYEIAGPAIFAPFPKVAAYQARMSQRPNIAQYLASGRQQKAMTLEANEEAKIEAIVIKLRDAGVLPPPQ
mmetsp:Transcript_44414/g.74079  ORF Transcript_44414/g.74079 Transcript_44414/m.74079 type:complete len:259 (+) Transcript_44414:158-934(+)